MDYKINLGDWGSVFAVPSTVVDKYIKLAGAVAIKTLLYLLRNCDGAVDVQEIAKELMVSAEDVKDAMIFWCETGVLSEANGQLVPADTAAVSKKKDEVLELQSQILELSKEKPAAAPAVMKKLSARPDGGEILTRLKESSELRFLFTSLEAIFSRTISRGEQSSIVYMYDYYGLPSEVIVMLCEYAKGIGKPKFAEIEKLAREWSKNGIDTHDKAEAHIHELTKKNENERIIRNAFGIHDRKMSTSESEYIRKWFVVFSFDLKMIMLAYDRTVDQTGKIVFKYLDEILCGWHENNYKKPADVMNKEKTPPKRKKSAPSKNPSFDIKGFEEKGLYGELKV